ncbi:hypothetical protein [Paraburkholderia sp.]|uniref:hypothetical protein n=1 Tax=Paraburkholderia sp. TaxID=1926495 RepID=UPI00239D9DFF|nr:hypothetical protein [Paraburkholderia sp.]MDE1181507.1 hypothetical protein [Paraburkholderia sp.]
MKKNTDELIGFFRDEQSMLIFALLYTDMELREKLLDITEELYESEKKAKKWRAKLIKKLHPDHHSHPNATDAVAKLNSIYERMGYHAE